MPEHQFVEQSAVPISTTTTSGKRSVTAVYAILWGGLVAGILDAVDGVIGHALLVGLPIALYSRRIG